MPNQNSAKTHCQNGHPLEGENLIVHRGRRHCRVCWRELQREGKRRNQAKTVAANRERNRRNPLPMRAYATVQRALKSGRLVRPDRCSECDSVRRVQAHHDDYSKPLEVRWLCTRCHGKAHRRADSTLVTFEEPSRG